MTMTILQIDTVQPIVDRLLTVAAENPQIAAGTVAFMLSWILYGLLGKRVLGADDDYWNRIRRWLLPFLDRLAAGTPGFYAEGENFNRELVGVAVTDIDTVERALESQDFTRNPVASLKTNPEGWVEDGSWARRFQSPRWVGTAIRAWAAAKPSMVGYPTAVLGRFIQSLGDVLAVKQVHVTLYEHRLDDGVEAVYMYAHTEPNALNPLTALSHYRGRRQDATDGVRRVQRALADTTITVLTELPQDGTIPPRDA